MALTEEQKSRMELNRAAALRRRQQAGPKAIQLRLTPTNPSSESEAFPIVKEPLAIEADPVSKKRALPFSSASSMVGTTGSKTRRVLPAAIVCGEAAPTLPALHFLKEVLYCQTHDMAAEATSRLKRENVLGFDIEWRVTFEAGVAPRGVATVQLCGQELCAIFQTSAFGATQPKELADILADPLILKVTFGP